LHNNDLPIGIPTLDERIFQAPEYRLTALRELWLAGSKYAHLAKPGRPIVYTREDLAIRAGFIPLDLLLDDLVFSREFFLEASVVGGFAPASWWYLQERAQIKQAVVDQASWHLPSEVHDELSDQPRDLRKLAGRLKRIRSEVQGRKPKLGELAFHLMDHEQLSRRDAIDVAKYMECFDVHQEYWSNSVSNGRKRFDRGKACRFDAKVPR
jgi:hypothetical protein